MHDRGHEQTADDGRVDDHRDGEPEPEELHRRVSRACDYRGAVSLVERSALRAEERALLDLLDQVPLWRLTATEAHVEATRGEVTFRFSPDRSPVVVAPRVPDGYPYALAVLVWRCVRYGDSRWWLAGHFTTADLWHRAAGADYVKNWSDVVDWLPIAPVEPLIAGSTRFAELRPGVLTDDDAVQAAEHLCDAVLTAAPHPKLSGFFSHLDEPQTTVAQQMVAAGWEVATFWGPEQMDVWRLTLRRGPVQVSFGIERGFSYGIEVHHELLRERAPGFGWPSYDLVWLTWKWRTKAFGRDPDSLEIPADTTEWPQLCAWLSTASRPDVATIDALIDATRELLNRRYRSPRKPATPEERIEVTRRALGKGR